MHFVTFVENWSVCKYMHKLLFTTIYLVKVKRLLKI